MNNDSMAPQLTMDFQSESSASWAQSDFDSSWDDFSLELQQQKRGRESERKSRPHRSRSDDGPHNYVPPQCSIPSPPNDRRRGSRRKDSPKRRQRKSLKEPLDSSYRFDSMHRVPASEPTYLDVKQERHRHPAARALSPDSTDSSITSRERLNLFPSPMKSPVLHRKESIEFQAKRAARANPITPDRVSTLAARDGSPQKEKKNASEALLMFGDPEETDSVMTGMSQQDLIIRAQQATDKNKRKDKRYRSKPKDKKKGGVRILNLPSSRKGNGSPSRVKYHHSVPEDDRVLHEQAPSPSKQKNLLSRYSGSKKRTTVRHCAVDPVICPEGGDRRSDWKLVSPASSARSLGAESTQSSHQDELSQRSDELAQAAENWIKSNEETHAAQFTSAIDLDDVEDSDRDDVGEYADGFDQASTSTKESDDDERPTEEDGAFPTLDDARLQFGPSRLSFDEQAIDEAMDVAQWRDEPSTPSDLFVDSKYNHREQVANIGTWDSIDKTSEESPISVTAIGTAEAPRRYSAPARPTAQDRPLLPRTEMTRRPASILRVGRHSGAREEVSARIQSVRSARVRFHEEVLRSQMVADKPVNDVANESFGSYQSSNSGSSPVEDRPGESAGADILPPQDWADLLERDARILSSIPESEHSLQTEPSESKTVESGDEVHGHPNELDNDREWALDEHEQASLGDFGQFAAATVEEESAAEEHRSFMETVASIVIQTAVRRMLAINLAESMLLDMSLEKSQSREYFASEYDHNLGIVPLGSEQAPETFPLEHALYREEARTDNANHVEAPPPPSLKNVRQFDTPASQYSYDYEENIVAFPPADEQRNEVVSPVPSAGVQRRKAASRKGSLAKVVAPTKRALPTPAGKKPDSSASTSSDDQRNISFSSVSVQFHQAAPADVEQAFATFPSMEKLRPKSPSNANALRTDVPPSNPNPSNANALRTDVPPSKPKRDSVARPPVKEQQSELFSTNDAFHSETTSARRVQSISNANGLRKDAPPSTPERASVAPSSVNEKQGGLFCSKDAFHSETTPVRKGRSPSNAPSKPQRAPVPPPSVNEQQRGLFSSEDAFHSETSPALREKDHIAFPSVAELRNGLFHSEGDQRKEAASASRDRDPKILPSLDMKHHEVKQEKDFEILPAKDTLDFKTGPVGAEVHFEAVPYYMYDIAATQIQSTFRGWWVRDSLNVDHYCACRIQRAYRSYRARMTFVFDIYRIAIVQSLWRRKLAQREVEKLRRVEAEKRRAEEAEQLRREVKKREAEKRRVLEAEKLRREAKKREAEKLRREAEQRRADEEAEKLRREAEQRRAEEAEKLREAEQRRAEEEEAKKRRVEEAEKLRREADRREAEKRRVEEAEKLRREAEQRRLEEAEKLREAEQRRAEEEEAEKLRKEAEQREAEKPRAEDAEKLRREVEKREAEQRRVQEAEKLRREVEKRRAEEAEKLRREEEEREAEKRRVEEAEKRRREAEKRRVEEAQRIQSMNDAAATTIQSKWRSFEARRIRLDRLVQVLIVQSVARRWLAKRQADSRALDRALARTRMDESEDHQWPRTARGGGSDEAQEQDYGLPDMLAAENSPGRQVKISVETTQEQPVDSFEERATLVTDDTSTDVSSDNAYVAQGSSEEDVSVDSHEEHVEISREKIRQPLDRGRNIHRVESEADAEGEDHQWVKVSDSYDEETLVQSCVSKEKSAVASLESKDKAQLSADEVIELFIRMSASATPPENGGGRVTPLRMENPITSSEQARDTSIARETPVSVVSMSSGGNPKIDGRPPRMEKYEDPAVDREVQLAKEKADRMNAKLAAEQYRNDLTKAGALI